MKYSNLIAWFLAIFFATAAMSLSGGIILFINIPSILVVFGISYFMGVATFGWKDFNLAIKALFVVFQKKVPCWLELKHLNMIESMRSYILLSGLFGVITGAIGLLANLDDPRVIGPALAVMLLTIYLSIFLILFLCQPALSFFQNHFAALDQANNFDSASKTVKPDIKNTDTANFHLRGIKLSDAPAVQKAASVREIADSMISLPHPYPIGEAEQYILQQQGEIQAGTAITFCIRDKKDNSFIGLVEIREIEREHSQAELSFWLAQEFWGRGYMSEVIKTIVQYAFKELGLNRLYAYHMLRNPATGKVLEKNGFSQEGLLRQRVWKWDRYEDVALWAILLQDWQNA